MRALVADALDQLRRARRPLVVEAAGRLVEQQELRLRRERARELDALLDAERQIGDARGARHRARSRNSISSQAMSASACSSRRIQGRRSALLRKSLRPSGWPPTRTLSSTDMVRNSARFWNVRPMPMSAMRCGGRSRMVRALEQDVARGRRVEAAQAVEQRGLAGAVRPDQAEQMPSGDVERHVVERDDAAETHADIRARRAAARPLATARGFSSRPRDPTRSDAATRDPSTADCAAMRKYDAPGMLSIRR